MCFEEEMADKEAQKAPWLDSESSVHEILP